MQWGELLLRKKWPVLLAIGLALGLHVADGLAAFGDVVEYSAGVSRGP